MPTIDRSIRVSASEALTLPSPEQALQEVTAGIATQVQDPYDADTVDTFSLDYEIMLPRWQLIDDLRGGTLRMREQATDWLPPEEHESSIKHRLRISRSILYNGYKDGVDKLAARPFARPVQILGSILPTGLQMLMKDANGLGQPLREQGEDLLKDAIHHGLSHILIDFARMPAGATLADEREMGARPVFVHIPATALIGWKTGQTEQGHLFLTEIRYRESTTIYTGTFTEEQRDRIRVYRPNSWELWELHKDHQGKMKWFLIDEGVHTFGRIPLVTLYTDRAGFMIGRPALEDLAWTNLAHFQSASEQRNLLRFARIGILFGTGFSDTEITEGINLAPNTVKLSSNPEAKLAYVEHTGGSMEIGEQDLAHLERHMDILALKPLIEPQSGTISATGQAIEEAKSQSALQGWVRGSEMVYEQAFNIAAEWTGDTLNDDDFKVDIFNDFAISPRTRDDILALLEARGIGEISRETLLEELQRRGLLAEHRIIADEVKAAEADLDKDDARNIKKTSIPRVGGTGFNKRRTDGKDTSEGGESRLQRRDNDPSKNLAGSPR